MRILHTSDWHIGHRLHDHERAEEHQLFLTWLLHTIEEQRIDLLVVAGDIFDTGNPTHQALAQYYDFLVKLLQTCCRNIIIIGGNHDSPGTLNAPKEILKHLNIHVVGKAHQDLMDEIIYVKDRTDKVQSIVCAVPFLRDKDIRQAIAGESYTEIEQRLKEGIIRRYQHLAEGILPYKSTSIPILATGHLFAAGGWVADEKERSEKDIHIGNLGQIRADQFPVEFDYIALGHLHRPQKVNGQEHIRYAGSPIPLSFTEFSDEKVVLLLNFEGNKLDTICQIPVPTWRKLVRFKGDLNQITNQLLTFDDSLEKMRIWAEVKVELDHYEPNITQKLHELVKHKNMSILKTQTIYTHVHQSLDEQLGSDQHLHELRPEEVFRKKCESEKFDLEGRPDVLNAFKELLSEMEENE